ncbi:MAG TPA: hypothetical protein ENO23_07570, partial [Alphaproteobacteria bacterium]|nr:hypothetical protein [Alphaproteobacteria bacterium]
MRSVFLLLLALLLSTHAVAGEVRVLYRFASPDVEVRGGEFQAIVFNGAVQLGPVGEPSYPFRGARILLPRGDRAASVRIERRDRRMLGGRHRLVPRQAAVPVGAPGRRALRVNRAAYEVDRWVRPAAAAFRTHRYRGHPIAVGSFSP